MKRRNAQSLGFRVRGSASGVRYSTGLNARNLMIVFLFLLLFSHFALVPSYADDISARAAVVIDGSSGNILYAKNPNAKLFPASTTKLVTAMVVLDKLNPEIVVTISANAANTPSVSPHLRAGEKLKVKDLLNIALIRSVNSAAVALAEAVSGSEEAFAKLMNEKAAAIGAENTSYINASGLPGDGQHITAYDLSLIMRAALRYPMIKEIINTRAQQVYTEGGRKIFVKNTNHLLWSDEDMVGGKTGYTKAARHCFVCAGQKGDSVLIAAVLGESVRSELWHDASTLLLHGEDVLAKKREPEIYYTSISESPVVYASQKVKKKKGSKFKAAKKGANKSKVKKKKRVKKKSSEVSADNESAVGGIS
jgi:serine-type D-Ala-D-Ala carboxypeptidase (penicillin-binding protein 5/6)